MEKMVGFEGVLKFYEDKRVLLTGHTGFKGAWLCEILKLAKANITGYSLNPSTEPSLFEIANTKSGMKSIIGDVRNLTKLKEVFQETKPEIVLHLAAQPIVKVGYDNPVETYETNVMGTVNLLECCRITPSVKSVLNVTTDKVYENKEWTWGYRENEPLEGYDPYSNSKSCSELVTHSYKNSFFNDKKVAISTARAGNVIGGGDFAPNRIIPDAIRAVSNNQTLIVRNPYSTRPYQHVIEPLMAYLMIAQKQFENINFADCYNVGPDECDCVTTGELTNIFCQKWGKEANWEIKAEINAPHEANFLKLDCSKIKSIFKWSPVWKIEETIDKTCTWSKAYLNQENMQEIMKKQIVEYIEASKQDVYR